MSEAGSGGGLSRPLPVGQVAPALHDLAGAVPACSRAQTTDGLSVRAACAGLAAAVMTGKRDQAGDCPPACSLFTCDGLARRGRRYRRGSASAR
ncbi:hypothetical protein XFF6990_130030 [Xanthomonas citri pv. fuscans]|uniref:Uncharacterized protein n=1 Tax=Xanthomonas campestris pv. phaseoli TaxID=317013 RepID=A0A7Z7NGT0_XANCH|nr:hypothetical protein XFF6990_130030 [Xanthomonas citri pv. fuscans]SOO24420.1 hypothetical protein XFF6991_360033 [Xanthomonas phaseoli pv. phaseoli]